MTQTWCAGKALGPVCDVQSSSVLWAAPAVGEALCALNHSAQFRHAFNACCRSVYLHHVLAPDVALAGVLRQLVLLQVRRLVHAIAIGLCKASCSPNQFNTHG